MSTTCQEFLSSSLANQNAIAEITNCSGNAGWMGNVCLMSFKLLNT